MLISSRGETVIPDGFKAPSEYTDINLFMIGGPPKTKILQATEIIQIRYRKILRMIMIAYILLAMRFEYKELTQQVSSAVKELDPS